MEITEQVRQEYKKARDKFVAKELVNKLELSQATKQTVLTEIDKVKVKKEK